MGETTLKSSDTQILGLSGQASASLLPNMPSAVTMRAYGQHLMCMEVLLEHHQLIWQLPPLL